MSLDLHYRNIIIDSEFTENYKNRLEGYGKDKGLMEKNLKVLLDSSLNKASENLLIFALSLCVKLTI